MSITTHRMTGGDTGIKERLQVLAPSLAAPLHLFALEASTPASDHQRRYCEWKPSRDGTVTLSTARQTTANAQAPNLQSLWRTVRHGGTSLVPPQVLRNGCKNAYLHKNRHTLLGWVTLRFSTFARGACLAVAVAVAVLTLLLAPANAVPGVEQPAAGASFEFNKEDGTLYIDWSGPMVVGMADDLRTALDKYGRVLDRVVLFLDSAGGQVEEGDRVIAILNEIKLRHQLITVVPHGKLCASMCIPIFLQGEDRLAARASIWLFHEAAQRQANGELRADTAETWRLFRKYYAPAGVSTRWLKSIAPMIEEADLWQTGGDLISAKSGIILHPLGDRTVRDLTAAPVAADRGRDLPLGKKTAADEVGNAPITSEQQR